MIEQIRRGIWKGKSNDVILNLDTLEREQTTWSNDWNFLKNKSDWNSCLRRKDETSLIVTLSD